MVIWLNGAAGSVGLDDGILSAEAAGGVVDLDMLRHNMDDKRKQMLEAAQAEVQVMVEQARMDTAAMREAARVDAERARSEGYDAGRRQAALEWHEQQTGRVIEQAQILRNMHEKLATIVTAAVERIVHTEQREALYQRALRSVQNLAQGSSTLALRVSSDDYQHARAAIDSLKALQVRGMHIEVNVDPALKPGGCVFESEVGILDASLQTQLDGLRAAMARAVRKAVAAGDTLAGSDAQELAPHTLPAAFAPSHDAGSGEAEEEPFEQMPDPYEDETQDWHSGFETR